MELNNNYPMYIKKDNYCCNRIFNCIKVNFSYHSTFPEKWNPNISLLRWNSYYGLSSWGYGIIGLCMLTLFSDNFMLQPSISIPIELEAWVLIIQSFISFFADVYYISDITCWHIFDRITATVSVFLFISNLYWISTMERIMYVSSIPIGLNFLKLSRDACHKKNISKFVKYHTLWHISLPIFIIFWLLYRSMTNYLWRQIVLYQILSCNLYIFWLFN
jgi:hypothetical protein